MPKFKSVLAGLAIGTALSGGVVAAGASTASASTAQTGTQVGTQTSVLTGWGCQARRRCGWGWGRGWGGWRRAGWGGWGRHRGVGRVRIVISNHNVNHNGRTHHGNGRGW